MRCAFAKSWWKVPWTQLLHSTCKIAPGGGAQSCHRLESSWTPWNKLQQFWPVTTHHPFAQLFDYICGGIKTHTVAENSFYQIEFSTCLVFLLLFILQTQILSNDKSEASPPIFPKVFHALLTKNLWSSSAFLGSQGILFCFVFSQSYAKFYSCFS